MNLLFFKRKKEQPTSLAVAAAAVATQKSSTAASKSSGAANATNAGTTSNAFFEIPLESILPFLPESAVRHNRAIEPRRSVRLPLSQILPQLSRGRVITPLSDVLPQLPAEMVIAQMPYTGSEKISLPLEHVVAHLPVDVLSPRGDQRQIELNDADIPAPFSEDAVTTQWDRTESLPLAETHAGQAATNRLAETPASAEQPGNGSESQSETFRLPENLDEKPLFEPISMSTRPIEPVPQEAPAPKQVANTESTSNWRGQWVYVTVVDIVSAIPDQYLFESRESLQAQVDPARKIPVAIEDVVSQLAKGRIALRLSKIKSMLPEGFLVPDVADGEVIIGLDKVIDQLPEAAFTEGIDQQDPWKELEAIPTPFHEKSEAEQPAAEAQTSETEETSSRITNQDATPKENLIPMTVDDEKPVDADILAEVNRIEPLFVEKAKQPEIDVTVEPAVEATVLAVESTPTPIEEPKAEAILTPQPETIETLEVTQTEQPVVAQETPKVIETPAPAEPVQSVETPAAKEIEPPATEEPKATEPLIEASTEEEEDLDSLVVSADVPAETPATLPTVSKERIAEALNHLNTWSEEELHQNNLGPTLTQRIMEWRQHRGGFKDLRELLQIAGIGPKLFQRVLGFAPESLDDQTRAINRVLGVSEDHEMSLQEIVKCASKMQGVEGCIVAMSDGIYMTGDLPKHLDSQRVSAFAPQLFARVGQYVRELNVGTARRFTIFTDAQPITIFKAGDLFFIVIHKAGRFSKVLLNKCERISQEISRLCSKESVNR